jgi:hypothetical protein
VHSLEIETSAGEQIRESKAGGGSIRMERKVHPAQVQIEVLLQLFNTPGTEIAPGSNEIGENLKDDWLLHKLSVAQYRPNQE